MLYTVSLGILLTQSLNSAAVELDQLIISHEGEELRGVIMVSGIKRSNRNIVVLLAERETYRSLNLNYNNFLNDIKAEFKRINPVRGKLSLIFPYEPVDTFDILVEIKWDNGKLLRRYAVNLAGILPKPDGNIIVRISPSEVTKEAISKKSNREKRIEEINKELREVTVQTVKGDSWHNVATAVRQAYLSDSDQNEEQIMLALRVKNPEAFTKENSLRIGIALALPDYYEINQKDSRQARLIIKEMLKRSVAQPRLEIANIKRLDAANQLSPIELAGEDIKKQQTSPKEADINSIIAAEEFDKEQRNKKETANKLSLVHRQLEQVQKLISLKSVRLASLEESIAEANIEPQIITDQIKNEYGEDLHLLLEQRLAILLYEVRTQPIFWLLISSGIIIIFALLLYIYIRIKKMRIPRSRAAIMKNLRKSGAAPVATSNRSLLFEDDDFSLNNNISQVPSSKALQSDNKEIDGSGGALSSINNPNISPESSSADNFIHDNLVNANLDLARAYINMGENKRARSMLEEVIKNGSPEEQKRAQELISQIK